ncbi:hypothetical protein QC764_301436 [Podospora pseudoanserina]|uniref:Uncharacterized protein n=1 Tax=Podospora pseudoanserina TaxID=2609844 RepID=A0ABR0IC67_9PEZI|nr:hypothetical protein QC764_301436 [Podospora pseudoanserina]
MVEMVDHLSLQQLPDALQEDLEPSKKDPDNAYWTCTTPDTVTDPDSGSVPLSVDKVPVVIPVRFHHPLLPLMSQPPDPHSIVISPIRPLANETVEEILNLLTHAIGFYHLINHQLQVIVPEDFDYQEELHKYPAEFGGFKVNFIRESFYPTADRAESTPVHLTGDLQQLQSDASHLQRTNLPQPMCESKSKDRLEGKLEVLVIPEADQTKIYITVSTDTLAMTAVTAKSGAATPDWASNIQIASAKHGHELGKVTRVFDPSPQQTFPSGFTHDVSLVDTIGWTALKPAANSSKPKLSLQWLSQDKWPGIKHNSSKLALLDDSLIEDEAKSIGVVDSRCQLHRWSAKASSASTNRAGPADLSETSCLKLPLIQAMTQPLGKTWLPDRSSIEFGQPANTRVFGQSGTPVCVGEDMPDKTGKIAKVAGFSSFVQVASDVQRYDLEGEKL